MNADALIRHADTQPAPPANAHPAVAALWHAHRGEWDAAHACAQQNEDSAGCWVHAHLHREEGDLDNADYWYRRARQPRPTDAIDAERRRLMEALLTAHPLPEAAP